MGEHNRMVDCDWCRTKHHKRFLCDPVVAMLDAMRARGDEATMPTLEFDDTLPATVDPNSDQLLSQIVIQAAVIGLPGVNHPGIIITGMDADRRPLPKWMYAGTDQQLRSIVKLMREMADLAIRQADAKNREAK